PLAATTNRAIGGDAPAIYLKRIEQRAELAPVDLDDLLRSHSLDPVALRDTDFDRHFDHRAEALSLLVEAATGRTVQRDLVEWMHSTDLNSYDQTDPAVIADEIEDEDMEPTEAPPLPLRKQFESAMRDI